MPESMVITGCGWVTPAGMGRFDEVLRLLATDGVGQFAGDRCARATTDPEADRACGPHGGPGTRLASIALSATRFAIAQAGLAISGNDRVGLYLGTAFSGQSGMIAFGKDIVSSGAKFVSPLVFPETVGNFAASCVARALDIRGPNQTVCAEDDSGAAAVIEAMRLLEAGWADAMIAVGADVLADETLDAFDRQRENPQPAHSVASTRYAEAACALVLERETIARNRGATIWAALRATGAPETLIDREVIQVDRLWGRMFAASALTAIAMAASALRGEPVPVRGATVDETAWGKSAALSTEEVVCPCGAGRIAILVGVPEQAL